MFGAPDLSRHAVLVVEDDYFLASDLIGALQDAGAKVIGPYASETAALKALTLEAPTTAVIDLNLGGGFPQFGIARELRARGIPFHLLTGYESDAIPDDLALARRFRKPVDFGELAKALAEL
ncbi:MAG: hypothetical protein EON48_07455 [Acetobacteraceae bacterium]|nr:MAG: hypothetical protein EON48_07455 [Acetobacteraceae bacterium]